MALVLNDANAAPSAEEAVSTVDKVATAQLVGANGTTPVTLPDVAKAARGERGPIHRHYHFAVTSALQGAGVFIPQVNGHVRLELNGQAVTDAIAEASLPLPRGPNRILLVELPDRLWRADGNVIDLTVAGPGWVSLSSIYLGPMSEVRRMYQRRMMLVVVGPIVVAAVTGTLGVFALLLWRSRRDVTYAYFGVGTLGWGLHTAWGTLPWAILSGDHYFIGVRSLYWFFVPMLIIFCVRFSGGKWARFETALWAMAIGVPLVLYGARSLDRLDDVMVVADLALPILAAVGLFTVGSLSYRRLDLNKSLVLAFALVASLLAFYDWSETRIKRYESPVPLVPFSGILFAVFGVRMLVDRFARASRELELLNVDLEQRVATQNAKLLTAMEQMRTARDVAESADKAKTRFLAAASHDLRQPAHALALYMGALREGTLEPNQADLVRRMAGSLGALESLFSVLLDVSRIDAGAVRPDIQSFELAPLLRRLAEEFAQEAESRGLRIAVRLPPHSARAWSDPSLVERIVRNLLANAVKYTARGGVLVACRSRTKPLGHWRVEIWDTGLGISKADQARVFEEFYQVSNSERDRSQGLGLGLSMVQRMCELLDAPLQLRSRLGYGSCFAFSMPMANASSNDDAELTTADSASLSGMRVAMIEDDREVRAAMRMLLTRWGCEVMEGSNARELEANIGDGGPPDVLLADHRLGEGRTGPLEAELLFKRWGIRLPLMIVTGESRVSEIEAGGYACLAKPVSPAHLRSWLSLAWNRA